MQIYRVLELDLDRQKSEIINVENVYGAVDLAIKLHLEVYETYQYDPLDPHNVVIFAKGPFAKYSMYGMHRLVLGFRSPISRGFHISTAGGAAYHLNSIDVDAIAVKGKTKKPCIAIIQKIDHGIRVEFESLSQKQLFKIYLDGYEGLFGVRSLTKYIINEIIPKYAKDSEYIGLICVGIASFKTIQGAVYIPFIDWSSKTIVMEDWAARGGGGSVLAQAHNVASLVFIGSKPIKTEDYDYVDGTISRTISRPYIEALYSATKKYSYDLSIRTGGTFGSNYTIYRDSIPMLNWSSVLMDKDSRSKLFNLVEEYFVTPFNREIASNPFKWSTCIEYCPVRCKKMFDSQHIDYEPMNACGPMIGVIDFYKALEVLRVVDEFGFDAIEIGNVLGWIYETLAKGLLKPKELGLEENDIPCTDMKCLETSITKNVEIAKKLLRNLIDHKTEILKILALKGLRSTLKYLDKEYNDRIKEIGLRFEDIAVYAAYGDEGYMTPNFYWSPGVLAPIPILGRYWTYYTPSFEDPEKFAVLVFERAINELLIDNAGLCRFHRGYLEKYLKDLYREFLGIELDIRRYAIDCYKRILEYQKKAKALPVFWESKRVLELIARGACEFGSKEWCDMLSKDLIESARDWWKRFLDKFYGLLGETL